MAARNRLAQEQEIAPKYKPSGLLSLTNLKLANLNGDLELPLPSKLQQPK